MAPVIENQHAQANLAATPTANVPSAVLQIRQQPQTVTVTAVPTDDGSQCGQTNLDGGAIAGIVIGSIVGFVLIYWVLRSCFGIGSPNTIMTGGYDSPSPEKDYYRARRRRRRAPSSSSVVSPRRVAVRGRQHRDSSRRPSVYV